MTGKQTVTTIDEYISTFPPKTQQALRRLRAVITAAAPSATEALSYGIPTFDWHGRHLVHFGGFARHIGFYPTPSGTREFADELSAYKTGKGSIQFPLDQPLPEELIRRIVSFRIAEIDNVST